jgi:hypothetical protein
MLLGASHEQAPNINEEDCIEVSSGSAALGQFCPPAS